VFIFWWYYRYRYRPRQVIIASTSPGVVTAGNVTSVNAAPYPVYSQSGPVAIMPGGSTVHHTAYPPPSYAFHAPPPAYTSTSVVKQDTTAMTSTSIR